MAKLNGAAILEEAEKEGLVYRMKPGWRKYFVFSGILMCLLVITIPLGIWFLLIPRSARLGIGKEGFAIKWFGTSAFAYADIQEFRPAGLHMNIGGGVVGALVGAAVSSAIESKTAGLKGPLEFKLKGKWGWRPIPAHAIENSVAMAEEIEKRSGLKILQR
ncbi:MAG: hypothetical protein HYY84_15785 [Deltaproteobacteria bacterium]|nr:hypothetical protein [Deltaproteobacteria bacterium]